MLMRRVVFGFYFYRERKVIKGWGYWPASFPTIAGRGGYGVQNLILFLFVDICVCNNGTGHLRPAAYELRVDAR